MKIREQLGVFALFLIVTLIWTFPLALHLSDYLAGNQGEAHEIIWNFWWFKKAIVELKRSPFFTDYFFYPKGETLLFHDVTQLYALLSVPLQAWFNLYATYNILLIFSCALAGWGMYVLLIYLTQNRAAALIGAFIFAFSPWRMAKAMGHFHLFALEWVPLYVLYFFKTQEHFRPRHVLAAGFFLALNALNTAYYLFYCTLFSCFYIVFHFVSDIRKRNIHKTLFVIFKKGEGVQALQRFLRIFLLAMLLLSPLIIPMVCYVLKYDLSGAHPPEKFAADILGFFIPSVNQSIAGPFRFLTSKFTAGYSDNTYIGFAVIVLVMVALGKRLKKDKTVGFFAFSAAAFFILSLGMNLHVAGKVTPFPMPYLLAHYLIPGFAFSGMPVRIHAMTIFCLASLAAFGVRGILSQKTPRSVGILLLLVLVLLVEFLVLPFPLATGQYYRLRSFQGPPGDPLAGVPEFYLRIAKDKEDYALLDVTSGSIYGQRRVEVFYYQIIHGKKIIGGNLARTTKERADELWGTPFLSEIIFNEIHPGMQAMPCDWRKDFARKIMEQHNIRYVIVPQTAYDFNKYPPNGVPEFYGLCRIFADEKILVFESCPAGECLPAAEALF